MHSHLRTAFGGEAVAFCSSDGAFECATPSATYAPVESEFVRTVVGNVPVPINGRGIEP
jgi:hypothetical protein